MKGLIRAEAKGINHGPQDLYISYQITKFRHIFTYPSVEPKC